MAVIFIDRDGVINRNRKGHVRSWQEFEFLPGAVEALVRLAQGRHSVFVVTNQAVVNRGIVSRGMVDEIDERMVSEVQRHGGRIEAVMVCPHEPQEGCSCRKPMPGLMVQIGRDRRVNLADAYLVGDFLTDVEAARAAGCTPILVRTGRGNQALRTMPPDLKRQCLIAHDLLHAVEIIEQRERSKLAGAQSGGASCEGVDREC